MCDDNNMLVDDGGLDCLHIPRDVNSRSFNCETTSQSKLLNTTFWVVDIIENVATRFSKQKETEGKMLVKIKPDKDSPETEARKFFTGSQEVQYILRKVKELDKFPRRVTMRGSGNRYYKVLLQKIIRIDYYEKLCNKTAACA